MAGDEEGGPELGLAELSRASRVSPRTIRYYINQGLLPSPAKRGRGARYDRGVLDRLKLIQLLQRDRWPLGKIAERLQELDDEGVRRELVAPKMEAGRSLWEHVRVDPGVEISVRTSLSPERRKVVERLIESARRMLD